MAQRRATAPRAGDPPPPSISAEDDEKKKKIDGGNPPLCWTAGRIWTLCLAFRALNSLLVRTYFDPDEHWQSLEVAHRIAFGYGHLTWEWKEGIRSYAHPLVFALLYKLLDLLHLDTPWFMTRAPRLFQSVFSSIGDLYLYKLSHGIFDEDVAHWALFCQLTNWFMFFCISRTYSNCLETVLTTVALYYWLSPKSPLQKTMSRKLALFVAALACVVRPTSAIVWLYLGFSELVTTRNKTRFLFLEVIPIGMIVFTLSCLLDCWMYGSWVIVPLNFLKFNFLSHGANYYGTHKWHWYFTQGFPAIAFTFLPLSLHGIFKSKKWKISCLIAWVLLIYSLLGHKEFRFVLPMLPVALVFAGYSLAKMPHHPPRLEYANFWHRQPTRRVLIVFFLIITNISVALYTSLIHQRGREDVMNFLAEEAHKGRVKNALFLMPCHSTPYYSTLHHNLPMRFLDCSPGNNRGILSESDSFKADPFRFVLDMVPNWTSPSHIILFDHEEVQIRELLISHSFTEDKKFLMHTSRQVMFFRRLCMSMFGKINESHVIHVTVQ